MTVYAVVDMSNDKLKRILGLPEVVFIAVGFTIGGGVFVLTGIVLKITGPALPLVYAVAVIPVFISMMPLAMLGSAIPSTGGNYKYPSRLVSPGLAFVGIWIYALASFFGQIPLYATTCARYAQLLLPGIPVDMAAVGIVTLFFVLNLLGIRPAAQVQGAMVIVLISALLFYTGRGFSEIDTGNFKNFFQKGAGNFSFGVALLSFTYLGSNAIIELGGEIKNPGRMIPRAFFIAFPIVVTLYVLVSLVTAGVVPWQDVVRVDEPLIEVGKSFLSDGGMVFFVLGGAVLAITTTLNALFIVGTKSLLMTTDDAILPKSMGRISRRFGTPYVLLIIIWGFSMLGISSGLSVQTFASYASLGGIIILLPVLAASLALPKCYPDRYEKSDFRLTGVWLWACPFVGLMVTIFLGAIILYNLRSTLRIGLFVLFALSGVLYYRLRKHYLQTHGINLDDIMKREDWDA